MILKPKIKAMETTLNPKRILVTQIELLDEEDEESGLLEIHLLDPLFQESDIIYIPLECIIEFLPIDEADLFTFDGQDEIALIPLIDLVELGTITPAMLQVYLRENLKHRNIPIDHFLDMPDRKKEAYLDMMFSVPRHLRLGWITDVLESLVDLANPKMKYSSELANWVNDKKVEFFREEQYPKTQAYSLQLLKLENF